MGENSLNNCPAISVIVPAYNAETTLERAVQSALSQVGVTLEVIVIDDCSSDKTIGIARAFEAADSRVVVIARSSNVGVSGARNEGLKVARGSWVTPLDADDSFKPGRLAAMLSEAARCRADILADNLVRCDIDHRPLGLMFKEKFAADGKISLEDFVKSSAPGSVSLGYIKPLIRRDFLTAHNLSYPNDVTCAEDWYLYFSCLLNGAKLFLLPDAYYNYAIHPESNSRQRARMVENASHSLLAHKKAYSLALEHGNVAVAAEMKKRLLYYRRFLLKQRAKKMLLDIPPIASFVDWRKARRHAG